MNHNAKANNSPGDAMQITVRTHDFGQGPVSAHHHPRGGGWVADTAVVSPTAFVGPDAKVYDHATVGDGVAVHHDSRVFDIAMLSGPVVVQDRARVFGRAMVSGPATISGDAIISDTAGY